MIIKKGELKMKKVILLGTIVLVVGFFIAGMVWAGETIPNLVGTWESQLEKNYQHSAEKGHKMIYEKLLIVIEGQAGRSFFGHKEKLINQQVVEKEKFSGVIYWDDKTIYSVDHEKGITQASIESTTEIRGVFLEEGSKVKAVLFIWKKIK
jgi:hypothetical protein